MSHASGEFTLKKGTGNAGSLVRVSKGRFLTGAVLKRPLDTQPVPFFNRPLACSLAILPRGAG